MAEARRCHGCGFQHRPNGAKNGAKMKVQYPSGAAITPTQLELVQSGRALLGEMYTFYLADGTEDYFSSLDIPINFNGHVFKANSLRIDGMKFKLSVGVNVDEQDIKISAYPGDKLAGGAFLSSILDGAMDGGYVARDRGWWEPVTGVAALDYQNPPSLVIRLSYMRWSTITKGGRTHVEAKLKSPMVLLNINMPRNYYTPGCRHTLYDSQCTLVKAAYGKIGIVDTGSTLQTIAWKGGVVNPVGGDSLPNYAQGRLLWISGPNENAQFPIANNDTTYLQLMQPMDIAANVGDVFIAYAGCSKMLSTCKNKFNNSVHWRGFDLIPPVYVSL